MATIKATDLANLLATNIDSTYQIIVFDSSGDTYQVEFEAATHQANENNGTCCTLDEAYDCGGDGVGREIDAVDGAVKVSGTDGILVTGTFGSGEAAEISGAGTRMFFNPAKAAFRAGSVAGTEWDDGSIGNYSFSVGNTSTASGENSVSLGGGSVASGDYSFAFGVDAIASDYSAFAFGESTASGTQSIAIGTATASGGNSVSIGSATESIGISSTSMGEGTVSESYAETAIGLFNTDYTPTSTSAWSATDRLFVVGNGTGTGTRSDALIITKDGNTTMPTTTGALTPPVLTTTERDALTATAGMMIYNSTTNKHQGYNGTIWNDFY